MLIEKRHPVARILHQRIREGQWNYKALAKVAHVTHEYVRYLANYAVSENQIWYLMMVMDGEGRHRTKNMELSVKVSGRTKDALKSTGNMSKKSEEVFYLWRNQ